MKNGRTTRMTGHPKRAPDTRAGADGVVRVRGAREHNLADVDVDIPRDTLVVFTGVSGSGKSSLAFGTLFAEAQRRFLDSISPYARRLIDQAGVPAVDSIDGLPPAVALQQARGTPTARSSVGSLTTISNSLRMLYSRAGTYPRGQAMLHADAFSPNTPAGACPDCHGLGRLYDATEATLVPDRTLSIRERAVAAWPGAWHGQNLRDILTTLGIDVDVPWSKLPKKTRDWILFTDEQPTVPVFPGFDFAETKAAVRAKDEPAYMGTFTGARRHVLHTHANSPSERQRRRAAQFLVAAECRACGGRKLRREALAVTFAGLDIAALSALTFEALAEVLAPAAAGEPDAALGPEQRIAAQRIASDIVARTDVIRSLGLGYLTLARSTPTLSPGELQRLRLATQVRSQLFGVVYVLDEPSAGLHPADTRALLETLDALRAAGNSVFVVEHALDVIRHADWLVDIGPGAGQHGGQVLYSGPPAGLAAVDTSITRRFLHPGAMTEARAPRPVAHRLALRDIHCNNLHGLDIDLPLGVLTTVCGVSGSGKSSLVGRALVELVATHLGTSAPDDEAPQDPLHRDLAAPVSGRIEGADALRRLVVVDQKPIGRTPRSNVATYTGVFDDIRKAFAATPLARRRRYDAGQFSFNVAKGRCAHCAGDGVVSVELLFMPSVFAPCPVCGGSRYDAKTLEVKLRDRSIADVLAMTVADALAFFADDAAIARPLGTLVDVGLDYLRLGQPATELSGGEAQRVKLASELRRVQRAGTLYVFDEPTTGLHPADVERLLAQLQQLVDDGSTVVVVEHDMRVAAGSDWIVDMGPGAGARGGRVVAAGTPRDVAATPGSATAPFLRAALGR